MFHHMPCIAWSGERQGRNTNLANMCVLKIKHLSNSVELWEAKMFLKPSMKTVEEENRL